MGLFNGIKEKVKGQLANVVEWPDMDDDSIFYKWNNSELKKGSRLIIRPAQDAIFLYQGRVEGVFTDEGEYDIESQIIPFLSTLKGWKFGFDTGLRAEVLFINTREFNMNWGTKNAPAGSESPGRNADPCVRYVHLQGRPVRYADREGRRRTVLLYC